MNTCPCPNPPGGIQQCSDDQLAVCGYRNGQFVSGCFDRPQHLRYVKDGAERNLILSNWVLSTITGADRPDYKAIDESDLDLLRAGEIRMEKNGLNLKFSVPRDLDLGNIVIVNSAVV